MSLSQLSVGLGLLDLGFPTEAALAAADVYARHGRELARELYDLFRTMVWPVYQEQGTSPETIQQVVEKIKPLSIASLVSAYEAAMDETKRERIAERARRADPDPDGYRTTGRSPARSPSREGRLPLVPRVAP